MKARLEQENIHDIPALYQLDPRHARIIWHSVTGEHFVRALQGAPIPLIKTKRSGFGNSKVLAPAFRDPRSVYLVSYWLMEKAAMRLRRDRRMVACFSLHVSRYRKRSLRAFTQCEESQDTALFLRINRRL